MKKILCVLFGMTMILTACGGNGSTEEIVDEDIETEQPDEVEAEPEVTPEENNEKEEDNEIEADEEKVNDDEQEAEKSADGEEYEEYEKIASTVDITDHSVQTVEDNQEKRVLLFVNNEGIEQYKTIFIKHDNRLKIINLNGGGQILVVQ